jgi:ketosteroid isomerase-like protein
VLVAGDKLAARATWRGTLRNGQELTAHIATFSEVRDGRIFRHATYDCYEPF